MKISAPSLKLDMMLADVVLRESRPIIMCRMGVYDATAELSRGDILTFLRCLMRPSIVWAFAKIVFSGSREA